MKKLVLLSAFSVIGLSGTAFAGDGRKAAELFIRSMVRDSASLARKSNGNQAWLEKQLCAQIPRGMAVNSMARNISNSQGAWSHASDADKGEFKKRFMMYLAVNGVERLRPDTRVVALASAGQGNSYAVTAQIQGDMIRTSRYWLAANANVVKGLSDSKMAEFESEFTGGAAPGSHSSIENAIKSAFSVYTFEVRGVEVISYLKNRYDGYVAGQPNPGKLHPEYFENFEGVNSLCP